MLAGFRLVALWLDDGLFYGMIDFRTCEICGRPLEGPEGEQQAVENRPFDAAAGAALQRDAPPDVTPDSVCQECLREYRREIGNVNPQEDPPL